MTKRYGFHFISLLAVVVFMIVGYSPSLSVFYATVVTFALSFLRKETALVPKKLVKALADGSIGALNAATTCACAGIVVGVVTLTGLGLKFSSIVISYAGGSLLLTAIYTSLIVWIIGLAVPVTASYIICAVIAAPALIKLGVPDYAAHMFIFYYAVLSEVSPPTALSPFAAAAITGGDPYKTTLQSWKYTLPAFLVPFVFVLDPQGVGLLLTIPKGGSWVDIVEITIKTTFGLMALAAFAQNWALRQNTPIERGLLLLSGIAAGVPEPDRGDRRIDHRPRHQLHLRAGPDHRPRRVAVAGQNAGAATTGAYQFSQGVNDDDESEKDRGDTGRYAFGRARARRHRSRPAEDHVDRHRRHRRRLLSARRRRRQRAVEEPSQRAGHRRSHRRLGRQSQADRHRAERARLHHGRCRARCAAGPGQVQERQGAAAGAAGGLSEPHACGDGRRHRHRDHGRPQGQARLDRIARRRHRSDGVPRHRGRRPRQGQGHEARAARRRRIRQRHQGPQDRRVLLGRRHSDRRGDRPRGDARREDEADRPRRHWSRR